MNRISRRSSALLLLILVLAGGMGFFLYEYVTLSDTWIVSAGSPHVYNSANIGCGQVYDRSGTMLLDITETRSYAQDLSARESTLHWLGDRQGRISAPAIAHYAKEMTGYDPVNGLYSYSGQAGQAVLTLSAKVQSVALEAMGDRKGTVAVYNYKTGELLCAVTTPTYDPDNVPDIEGDETGTYEGVYLNRFIQSVYIPGSIFKVVTAAAALETIPDIAQRRFTCNGIYEYGIDKVSCERAHGTMTLETALANSCNCTFGQIANLVGADTLEQYVKQFQVTEPISFDGIKTVKGNFDLSKAAPVQIAWGGIGQYTDQINPCTFMTFMGAIAGGGKAAQPHIVAEVSFEGDITYRAEVEHTNRIMSEKVASTLQQYLRNNVISVYGDYNFSGMKVCAKSGTSQLGGGQTSNAMFTGFVMDEEYPLAFITVVENGGYGAKTCVPVISKVLSACKGVLDGE